MNEFKGTKGEWQIQPREKEGKMITSFTPKRTDICEVFYYASDDIEAQANTLLISHAPDLLKHVINLKEELESMVGVKEIPNIIKAGIIQQIQITNELITKATFLEEKLRQQ